MSILTHYLEGENIMLVDVVALSLNKCSKPIKAKLKYATKKNFTGDVVEGYSSSAKDFALMSPIAAAKLCEVQNYLIKEYGYGLLIYDAYRPKRAVNYFLFWSKDDVKNANELERKKKHYPSIEKNELFDLGYVAEDSGHCYGNTVDLVLIDTNSNKKLPMGARFDFMDEKSNTTASSEEVGEESLYYRKILREAMIKFNFKPYEKEYWHFTHGGTEGREFKEALDIPITDQMKGIGITI